MRGITDEEKRLLNHVMMWGSDGYPVRKYGRVWIAEPFPTTYRTKREAVAQFERYLDILRDATAGRI